ncbi:MAG: ATP-binding protein [bacterium]
MFVLRFDNLIGLTAAGVNLWLGLSILNKNRKAEINWILGLFLSAVALWNFSTAFTGQTDNLLLALFWRRLSSFSSALIVVFFLYFSFVFPKRERALTIFAKTLILLPGIFFAFVSISTDQMIKAYYFIEKSGGLFGQAVYGGMYQGAIVYYLFYLGMSLTSLIVKMFSVEKKEKLKVFYVLFGIGAAGLTAIFTSLVLPLLGFSQYVMFGPLTTLIMAAFIVYAIAAHRLLNIDDFFSRGVLYCSLAVGILGTAVIVQMGRVHFLPTFYIALFNLALAAFVYFQEQKKPINTSFSLVILIVAVWAFSIGMFFETKVMASLIAWSKVFYVVGSLTPGILLYFSVVFPTAWPKIGRPGRIILFLPSLVFCGLSLFDGLLIKNFYLSPAGITVQPGAAYPYFFLFSMLFMGGAFFNLAYKYKSAAQADKPRVRYVLWGMFIVGLFASVFNLALPFFGFYNLIWLGPYSTVFLTGLTSYAIVKHHLMDITLIISRTVAEILTISFFGLVYFLLAALYTKNINEASYYFVVLSSMAYWIMASYLFQKVRFVLQTSADKLFLRGKYDYYNALAEAGEQITKTLSMENINLTLKKTFSEIMEVADPRLLFSEAEIKPYLEYKKIAHIKDDLIVPCRLEERLIAVFVLGPKLSEDAYTDEDLRLLSALASQAAIAIDHTKSYERIKEDLLAAEKQLERSQRLASIGTLTAGVTHEIRNPMTVVRAKIETLFDRKRDSAYLIDTQKMVLENIDRVENIIQGMLDLSKNREKKIIEEADLVKMIEESLAYFPKSRLKVIKEFKPIPKVKGVKVELQQAIINIIQNAIEAMPNGGTLTLKTFEEDGRPAVTISDTGKGIPVEMREKIFDPFFSGRHEGTGLGLSIVYRIIREHGGDIKVKSEVGKGTTFKLLF